VAGETFKLGLVLKAFDGVTGPLRKINASLEQFQKPIRKFEGQLGALVQSTGLGRLGESFAGIGRATSNLGSAVTSLAGKFALLGSIAGAALTKVIYDTVETASHLIDLRNATGAGVESIQTLGYAFEQSGGNAEDFQAGLVKFAKNLGDARRHAGPLFQILQKYDRPLLDKMLKTKDTGEALRLFINRISQAKTDTGRLALATAAVGKTSNKALASLAKDGAENLKMLEKQTPGLISEEDAARAESFGDVLHRLSRQLGAMSLPIVSALIPSLDSLSRKLTDFLHGKEEAIRAWAHDFGEKLPGRLEAIGKAFQGLWQKLLPIRKAFSWIIEDSDRLQIALGVLAVLISSKVLLALGGLVQALVMFGYTLLTNPIGWFILALGALIGIGWLVVRNWEKIKDFFVTLWNSPAGAVFRMFSPLWWLIQAGIYLVKNWDQVKEFFTSLWNGPVGAIFRMFSPIGMLITAGQFLAKHWEKVKDVFSKIVDLLKEMSGYSSLKRFLGFGKDGTKITGFKEFFEQEAEAKKNLFDELTSAAEPFSPPKTLNLPQVSDEGFLKSLSQMSDVGAPGAVRMGPALLPSTNPADNRTATRIVANKSEVTVKFENLPKGTRVERDPRGEVPLNLSLGYSMAGD